MSICGALIDVSTADSSATETCVTGAFKGSKSVLASCVGVAIVSICVALIHVCTIFAISCIASYAAAQVASMEICTGCIVMAVIGIDALFKI